MRVRTALVALSFVSAHALHAQQAAVSPELRGDAIFRSHVTSLQLGAGVQVPAGIYVRIGVDAAAGYDITSSDRTLVGNDVNVGRTGSASGRVDIIGRFLLDPFRQTPYGLSAGAGLSLRATEGDRVRPLLLAVVDLEGRRSAGGWSPALQLGLGGGVRVGVVLRRSAPGTR